MKKENHPVKDYLFSYIKKSEKRFHDLLSQKEFDKIISDILENCYFKVALMDTKEESLSVLATGILHYMLTNVMLPSQRKIEYKKVKIDIVVPDLQTLENDPKKALIICIPNTLDKIFIKNKLKKVQQIQPEKQNIWFVLTQDIGLEYKTYVIKKENSTFTKIIYDIGNFVNVQGENKFKILRV